jgi:hypothetical protein
MERGNVDNDDIKDVEDMRLIGEEGRRSCKRARMSAGKLHLGPKLPTSARLAKKQVLEKHTNMASWANDCICYPARVVEVKSAGFGLWTLCSLRTFFYFFMKPCCHLILSTSRLSQGLLS